MNQLSEKLLRNGASAMQWPKTGRARHSAARRPSDRQPAGRAVVGPHSALESQTSQLGCAQTALGAAAAIWKSRPTLRGGDRPLVKAVGISAPAPAASAQGTAHRATEVDD